MLYLVASVYAVIGRNPLAIQFINAVLGAATAPLIYLCAQHIFSNLRVSRFSALAVAFYPSLILWSSQGLKDAPIVFLLALSMYATLRLGERIQVKYLMLLIAALFGILSLRFYIFYMVVVTIGGAFLIGMRRVSAQSLVRQVAVLIIIGLAMTYLGILRMANTTFERYGSFEVIQLSRMDLARSANSGFGKDVDVSTATGTLSAIPVGMLYLLFAPFPWQLANLRQSITVPEMVMWWLSFPLLILGLWFTIKHLLRPALPILLFTATLTLAYSIFQGNVGTAYRQRSQLLIFYFIFVAVGFVLLKEKRENDKLERMKKVEGLPGSASYR
jgi:4-amino-4-deoxy-L-arabinose transferase-like glycosyltransferase